MRTTTIKQSFRLLSLGIDPMTSDMHWSIFNHKGGQIFDEEKQLCFGRGNYTQDIDICDEEIPSWTPETLLDYIKKYNRNVSFNLRSSFDDTWVLDITFWDSRTSIRNKDLVEALIDAISWLCNGKKLEPEK